MYPKDRNYTRDHEWAMKNADNTITVGITDYAQEHLGDIVFLELPQIGWNSVLIKKQHKYLSSIPNITDFYFVNSFVLVPKNIEHVIAETQHDIDFCSVVAKKNIFGTQFHPEKSSKAGSKLIKNFLDA